MNELKVFTEKCSSTNKGLGNIRSLLLDITEVEDYERRRE